MMKTRKNIQSLLKSLLKNLAVSASALLLVGCSFAWGQQLGAMQPDQPRPKFGTQALGNDAVQEHPLIPVIRWAEKERPSIEKINDYTAIMTKQEFVNGAVQEAQVMEVKVRHRPLSVYLKFRYPKKLNGQEAIFVQGQNENKIVGHGVGVEKTFGTQKILPDSFIAMRGNKYPITEMGFLNLVDRLLEVGYKDSKYGECEVKYFENIKVDKRDCTLIQVIHPVPRKNFIFHIARIFVDNELNLPVRYESYDWPRAQGEEPTLIEAYSYRDVKINVGLTDLDFDYRNPAYDYSEGGKK